MEATDEEIEFLEANFERFKDPRNAYEGFLDDVEAHGFERAMNGVLAAGVKKVAVTNGVIDGLATGYLVAAFGLVSCYIEHRLATGDQEPASTSSGPIVTSTSE